MKKDKLRIYLSFSKECTSIDKAEVADRLNLFHPDVEVVSFWGGTYNREALFKDVDICLGVSWHFPHRAQTTVKASRGVTEELRYCVNRDIPAFILRGARTNCLPRRFVRQMEVAEVEHCRDYNTDTWDGDYGQIHLGSKIMSFMSVIAEHFRRKDIVKPISSVKPMLATARLLNLI